MTRALLTLGQALAVRAAPGLVNLFALSLVARMAGMESYGLFSLIVTTAILVSNTVFGVVTLPIVSQYAQHRARDDHHAYAATLFGLAGLLALGVIPVGAVVAAFEPLAGPGLIAVLVLALHGLCQELLRARHSLYSYGASDLIQAVGFLAAALVWLGPNSSASGIVGLFAASYVPAIAVSLFGLRGLKPARPRLAMVRDIVSVGRWLALNTLTENILFTGARYLILAQAGAQALGVFSFAVDIAQRSVAFMVNAASFIFVPRAFSARAAQGHAAFVQVLRQGVWVSLAASAAVMAAIAAASVSPHATVFLPPTFDLIVFCIVSAAAVVNRIKKLLLDSLGLAASRAHRLAAGNLIGAALGLAAMAVLAGPDRTVLVSLGYLAGYVAIFAGTAWLIRETGLAAARGRAS